MIVEVIPYSTFKERVSIVNKYIGQAKIEVTDEYVCVTRYVALN